LSVGRKSWLMTKHEAFNPPTHTPEGREARDKQGAFDPPPPRWEGSAVGVGQAL
jgi:hypothetical protein